MVGIHCKSLEICIFVYSLYFHILYTLQSSCTYHITEEIERREKTLVDELNLIEVQVGLNKPTQNFEESASLHAVEAPRSVEEGEENRDPNPELNIENIEIAINDNVDVSMQSINENSDNDHDMKDKEEVQLDQLQLDENDG